MSKSYYKCESWDEYEEDIETYGGEVGFDWDGHSYVIDGLACRSIPNSQRWNLAEYDDYWTHRMPRRWTPLTPGYPTFTDLAEATILDGKSIRELFPEIRHHLFR